MKKTFFTILFFLCAAMQWTVASQVDYSPSDSPDQYSYYSNTYTEAGWTDISVSESYTITSVEIAYTWFTDGYPSEGSFYLKSPSGTTVEIASGESSGTYNRTLSGFNGESMNGDWELWIVDSYGDGGHQATGITVSYYYDDPGPSNPSPSDGATDVVTSGTLTWDFSSGTNTYDLWFGLSGNMSKVVDGASAGASGSYNFSGLDYTADYQWQVIEYHTGETIDGDVWSFTTTPDIAQNPSPANNATGVSIASALNWDDVYGATSYTIDIGTSSGSADIVDDAICPTSDYTHSSHWIPGTTYYWTVSSIIDGSPHVGTEWQFTALDGKADNPVPANNIYVGGSVTLLNWDDMPLATGYTINVGTTPGGNEIASNVNLTSSEYSYPSGFPENTFIYWSVTSIIDGNSYSGDDWFFRTALPNNEITSLADLSILSQFKELWTESLTQTADIDASPTKYWDYSDDNGDGDRYNDPNDLTDAGANEGWKPVGTSANPYWNATYDGNNHTIDGLALTTTSNYVGFIGNLYTNGHIINLGITNVNFTVSGSGQYVGGLCGYTYGFGTLTIDNCYSTGVISATNYYAGGLVGFNSSAIITNCYSTVNINGNGTLRRSAGFVGQNQKDIEKCYSMGTVNNVSQDCGGFCGFNQKNITNCFSRGDVTRASGSSDTDFGGFIGYSSSYSSIQNCYSTGRVMYTDATNPTDKGFVGGQYNTTFNNNFFDMNMSGQSTSTGATGKSTSEMNTQSTFENASWDFINTWSINSSVNEGYPYLQGNPPSDQVLTWDGSESIDWNNPANWSNNFGPTAVDNIVIPTGLTNYPVASPGTQITCNYGFTIHSGATFTLSDGASLITSGSITNNGSIFIQKELVEDRWSLISSPVAGTTASLFTGDYLMYWDEPSGKWYDVTTATFPLVPAKGYSVWPTSSGKPTQSYTFTGTPNNGVQSVSLTSNGTGGNYNAANLIGNPYPSGVDWDLVTGYGSKYTWNGTGYDAYVAAGGYGTGSRYVNPVEGFFIIVESAGTFEFSNSQRIHIPSGSKNVVEHQNNRLIIYASNGSYNDDLWMILNDEAHQNFELERDAWKLITDTPGISQLWSICPDGNLSVDVRPYQETIQLGFANDQAGFYSIGLQEIEGIGEVTLEDTKTNTLHDLSKGAYEFTWNPDLDYENRFKLHLNAVGIEETQISESDILIYAANQQIFVKGAENGNVLVSDLMGRIVMQQEIPSKGLITMPVNLQTGVYVIMVQTGNELKTEKVFLK